MQYTSAFKPSCLWVFVEIWNYSASCSKDKNFLERRRITLHFMETVGQKNPTKFMIVISDISIAKGLQNHGRCRKTRWTAQR